MLNLVWDINRVVVERLEVVITESVYFNYFDSSDFVLKYLK